MDAPLLDDLAEQITKGQVVAVIGAGVSMAATDRAEASGWIGLLRLGIDRCMAVAQPRPSDQWARRQREALDSGDVDELLAVAEQISSKLGAPGGGEFRRFLRETVGTLAIKQREVLEALRDLAVPLTTTNYDELITAVTGRPAVTWQDGAQVQRVLRGDEEGILHLHGFWQRPETVVLGIRSYERVLGDAHAQTMQQALAGMRTLLFIGCGAGLSDPNFGALRDWIGKVFAGSEYRHYRLCRTDERDKVQAEHLPEQRTFALAFGDHHEDLGPFLCELVQAVRKRRPPAEPAMSTADSATAVRLPPKPRLFGRDNLVESIVENLLADPPPPVPVLGGPGIGKTTVSLAALHDSHIAIKFGPRRFFVRCEPAATADALIGEIARAIGLELGPDLEARLFARLEEAPAVLVLDNAETPWEADTEATERLLTDLSGISSLALLATIRSGDRPLGPAWRETITVGPLPLNNAKQAFLAVAGGKHAGDPLLDTLVGALDGLPLAITLMAHRVETEPDLSGTWHQWQQKRTELLRREGSKTRLYNASVSFELSLTGPRMTAAARRLLSIAARLPDGIIHGDLDALLPDEAAEAARVLRAVGLAHDERGRLRLLAPVREYVAAAHPPEEADGMRVLQQYIELAQSLGPQVGTESGAEAVARLAADLGNIETMIRLALAAPDPSEAIHTAIGLGSYYSISGFGSGDPLKQAAVVAKDQENDWDLADCIKGLGDIALYRSDHDAARARYEEALPLYRQVGDVNGEANCIFGLGVIALNRSDHAAARARYEEALPLYRQVGEVHGEANCIFSLGDIALERFDHAAARARYEEALPLYRQVGDVNGEANCIQGLGSIALNRSDHAAARARYEEVLPLYRQVGNVLDEANCIKGLGDIALERSDHAAARARYEEALPLYRQVGDVNGEADCIQGLGSIALKRPDHDAARARYEEALNLYVRIGKLYSIGRVHEKLARISDTDTARQHHVKVAREVWRSSQRGDLIRDLDAEFGGSS